MTHFWNSLVFKRNGFGFPVADRDKVQKAILIY